MRKDLDGTINVLDGWLKDIKSLEREIAEVNSAWITELGNLETDKLKEVGSLSKWLKDNISTLPAGTKSKIENIRKEEKKKLEVEASKLDKTIKKHIKESAELEIEINKHRKEIEKNNPDFDDQEEALKEKIQVVLADVKDVNNELGKYDSFKGWFNGGKVKKLKKEFDRKMMKLNRLTGRLEELRSTWHKKLTDKDADENEKQEFWAKLQNFITEDKFEMNHIIENLDDISLTNTVLEMLDVDSSFELPKEQTESLTKAKRLKSKVESINKGIKRLASLIGAVNGVGKGLGEMNKSFHSLRKTQRAHTQLPKLSIEIPDPVIKYNSIWQTLIPKVKNESKFVDDPTHLADEFDKIGSKYLSMENIKTMFDMFGKALKESTAGWSA